MRMLTFSIQLSKSILIGALVLGLGAPAMAGTLYRWTTDDGTIAYTDDAKRIPARYRGTAVRQRSEGLSNYSRYTPKDDEALTDYAERLEARVARLRALNEALDTPAASADPGVGYETVLRVGRRSSVRVTTPTLDEPITVESVRVRPRGSAVTQHITVVRQGDRVLSVRRPSSSSQPLSFPDESGLIR